ncbi:MAG: TSUP family transporter, partial [Rhodospirillales bacterium]|nr:TSUP family transporter [Rhodospirillales bacterium]
HISMIISGTISFLLASVLATSFISGVLSLGGGTLLMGIFAWVLPVSVAMTLHGVTQFTSNLSRWWLYRTYTCWSILRGYFIGAALCIALFSVVAYVPDKVVLFLLLGALPFINVLLPKKLSLSIAYPGGSFVCGVVNSACLLTAGVSGPILDVFYVKSGLTRFQIISTKGFTQTIGHLAKIFYFGTFLRLSGEVDSDLPYWVFVASVPLAFFGVWLAKRVIHAISDDQFRNWTQITTLGIGALFIGRAFALMTHP